MNEWMDGWWIDGKLERSKQVSSRQGNLVHCGTVMVTRGEGSELGMPQASAMLGFAAKPVAGEFHDD